MNNEIITLSSDEEREDNNSTQIVKQTSVNYLDNSEKLLSHTLCSNQSSSNSYPPYKYNLINSKNKNKIIYKENEKERTNSMNDSSPELVDIVELVDLSPKKIEKFLQANATEEEKASLFKYKQIDIGENDNDKLNAKTSLQNTKNKSNFPVKEISNIYHQFVQKCESLEKIQKDKERLVKKLYKYYLNSNPDYVKSQEFLFFVEKNKNKLNDKNLYLIAKEVTDELCLQRDLKIRNSWFGQNKLSSESDNNDKLTLRQSKTVNKILWKLSKLQKKIKELEETEVDLSDEEDSVYVKLQSYRNKFCQIYKRLCKITNQVSDANRMCCRNISFNGSPYLEINQCIEKWLNKTKRFPDFTDILKLIESQNSSFGLHSGRESLRELAEDIFRKVGTQLKERRKYDLWDSFCGYLEDSEDPAKNNPELEKLLNENYVAGKKKEQEVIKYYVEMQEKQKLEPVEISDEEANLSPNDSGNDDENEIEAIESSIDQKLYNDIEKELQDNLIEIDDKEDEISLPKEEEPLNIRESKNNFQNCKSLKWRKEGNQKFDSVENNGGLFNLSTCEEKTQFDTDESFSDIEPIEDHKNNCNSPWIDYTKNPVIQLKRLSKNIIDSYCKRKEDTNSKKVVNPYFSSHENEVSVKKLKTAISNDEELIDFDNLKKQKISSGFEVSNFGVRYCYIEQNFQNIFNSFDYFDDFFSIKKKNNCGKVFRDLTNTNNLFNSNGKKKRKNSKSFISIYKCSINSVQKPLWKKRFKVYKSFSNANLKEQQCALSHEEKTQTTVQGGGGADKKDFQNNSGSGDRGNCNFKSGRGSGNERDNNENDENKRNYKTEDDDQDENKYEDEEEKGDEEEEDEEEEKSGIFKSNAKEKVSVEKNQSIKPNRETLNCDRTQKNNEYEAEIGESVCNKNIEKKLIQEQIEEKKEYNMEKNLENIEKLYWTENSIFQQKSAGNEENNVEILVDMEKNENKNNIKKFNNKKIEMVTSDKSDKDIEMKNNEVDEKVIENQENCEDKQKTQREKEKNMNKEHEKSANENLTIAENKVKKTNEKKINIDIGIENETAVQTKKRRRSKFTPNLCPSKGNIRNFSEENKRITRLTRTKNREKETETKNERINYHDAGSRNYEALITAEATIGEQVVQAQVTLEEKSSNCHRITNSKSYTRMPENFFSKKMKIESLRQNLCKRKSTNSTLSPSDEERVKQFLLHSPSSISITPPKKLSLNKPPSQAALQALATLRNLKGISTTRVRATPKAEDDIVVIGESSRRSSATSSAQSLKNNANGVNLPKRKNNSFPIISNVESIKSVTPKIVGIQGSVKGFENIPQQKCKRNKNRNASSKSNSIKISNVWGALPNNFIQSAQQNEAIPSCSYPQTHPTTSKTTIKKNNEKTVEYVELD